MLSSSRRAKELFPLLAIAALTVTVRLPFLLHADRFFDSDEAVEGLMARHLLQGELPIFLWGQHYKGVPEVYLSGAVFAVFGSSVIALKAVTLACFVVFTCLQFRLIDALFSRRTAWVTTALAIVCPPVLVLWSLSANAEIVWTLLAGTVMGLALVRWTQSQSRAALAVAAAAVGFGLWVHQYIVFYVVALVVCAISTRPAARDGVRDVVTGRGLPAWWRACTAVVLGLAIVYVALGLVAFVTGGFDVTIADTFISMHNPQKLWRMAAALAIVFGVARLAVQLQQPDRRAGRSVALATLMGFVCGYAPALAATLHSRAMPPLARMDAANLTTVGGSMLREIVPMLLGFRGPLTDWLPVSPWFAVIFIVVIAASLRALAARPVTPFFHMFLVVVPILFVVSGSFVDAQSYRYLMPLYAALPVVLALGVDEIWRWSRPAAVVAGGAMVAMFAVEQMAWYGRLAPDLRAQAIVQCLTEHNVRGTRADYWLSYKVTFLSGERLIVAPNNAVDRYPPYTAFVTGLGQPDADLPCRSLLLQ